MTFIRKRSEHQDLRAGRVRLLFCANAVGFIIKTALIYNTGKPEALKGKDKHQRPVLVVQEGLGNESPFSGLVPSMLCP